MDNYIKGNKEAWEEAFELRNEEYGANIIDLVTNEPYAFFYEDFIRILKKYDLKGKSIGQFCCNNGRELLSLVKTSGAKDGVGFDIAENMVEFANAQADKLNLPCQFVAENILDIDDSYKDRFDFILITIGATCWFKNLKEYFAVISKCLKKGGHIAIHEQHPFCNMIASEGDEGYDASIPFNCIFSYFEHEWVGNSGMSYITGKSYESKTFTDYTHSISEFIEGLCSNGMVVTNMQEFDYDISSCFKNLSGKGFPLSIIIEGTKPDCI